MELIVAKKLSLAYDGVAAAEGVEFTLSEGDYLCVVGENGSGKSTLLKAVTGEIRPASGVLEVARALRREGIGYLPQQSRIQRDFPATVREVVLSGCIRRDSLGFLWTGESKKRAERAMDSLGILSLSSKCFGELSGGQRQRVLLARAMCVSERLLLLDEPVTGLDPEAAHEMYHAIREINEGGCAVMMVSHDIGCAVREAKKVLSLCRGHSFFGTAEEYASHEKADERIDIMRHDSCHRHECRHDHG